MTNPDGDATRTHAGLSPLLVQQQSHNKVLFFIFFEIMK